jgi:transposase
MRLQYAAGERMFVDFAGDTMPVVDAAGGEVTRAEIFVCVLRASGKLYAEAAPGQDLESWLMAPLRNRRFFSLAELNAAIREKVDELNRQFDGVRGAV